MAPLVVPNDPLGSHLINTDPTASTNGINSSIGIGRIGGAMRIR
jgi:hypothetical protein